jgi:hypothetical protein
LDLEHSGEFLESSLWINGNKHGRAWLGVAGPGKAGQGRANNLGVNKCPNVKTAVQNTIKPGGFSQ